ncbi:Uncharacterised protein [Vibrio cholerae]|nr:Uncharacterised protein [Vibrio cholerae]CSD39522.1 Uncharacterised protein [Vibrio cholerae]
MPEWKISNGVIVPRTSWLLTSSTENATKATSFSALTNKVLRLCGAESACTKKPAACSR